MCRCENGGRDTLHGACAPTQLSRVRAARCLFPGTAAGRLSWPAATARRCGGLCAMALLAAAVASRRSGPRHSDSSFLSQTALTSNRLLSAFQLSTRQRSAFGSGERKFRRQAEGPDASLFGELAVGPSGGGHNSRPPPVRDSCPLCLKQFPSFAAGA
jgi:hypothetical protein